MTSRGDNPAARIRAALPDACLTDRIERDGCRLAIRRLAATDVIVDMDHQETPVQPDRPRCDFVFVGAQGVVAPIELKKGDVDATEAARQLQSGADLAAKLLVSDRERTFLRPIAVSGRLHKRQRQLLNKRANFVKYGSKSYQIVRVRCGEALSKALR